MPRKAKKMKLPPAVQDYFRHQGARGGAIGGKLRFAALSDAEKTALGKKAAKARWAKKKGRSSS